MSRLVLVLLLVGSLGANLWLALRWRTDRTERRAERAVVVSSPPRAAAGATTVVDPMSMPSTVEEFQAFRTKLEGLGLPPDVVRAVMMFTVHRDFHRRRQALMSQPGPDEYWRNPAHRDDPATQAALRELEREQRKKVRELGVDDFDFDDEQERRRYGNLSAEKVARLKKIFSDYGDLEEQLFSDGADRNAPEGRARAELLAREKRADIERLLTPEELLQYDYRNSPGAHRLRGYFGHFQATEAEFAALYPTFKAIADETQGAGPPRRGNATEMRRAREAAEKQMEAAARQVLGDARYAALKEANDHLLRQTREFTMSLNLPPQAAMEVVAVQKEFAPKLADVDRDRDLTPNQRDAKAATLANEARERLIRVLGPANFEAYKRRGGGWLGPALNRAPPGP